MRIRIKFLTVFFIISFLPLVFLSYITYSYSRQTFIKNMQDKLEAIAEVQSLRVGEIVNLYEIRADSLATQIPILLDINRYKKTISENELWAINVYILNTQIIRPDIEAISLLDTGGKILASTNTSLIGKKRDASSPSVLGSKMMPPLDFLQHENAAPQMRLQRQLVKNGIHFADIEIILNGDLLPNIMKEYTILGSTGEFEMVKYLEDGSILNIVPRRFEEESAKYNNKAPSPLVIEALKKHDGFFSEDTDYRGKSVFAVAKYIPDLDWEFIGKIDTAEAFQAINAIRDVILIFSFVFVLLIVIVALFFVYSITAPILNMVSVAKQIRTGNFLKRAVVVTKDEIGELAENFNAMVDTLQKYHEGLEKEILERTGQLAAVNKDLEAFSYSVSHDLRAPLRSIDGFSKILETDYSAKFNDEGKHVIATIRTSTKRMGILIDDLLSFSRLGREAVNMTDVDMTTLAKTVFDELKTTSEGHSIQFTCPEIPVAYADLSLIRQVWINLISNAIKFTRKKEVAIISVGSIIEDESTTYFVKDNGVGFDMKYVDKLFVVFQRLHSMQDFEGTGIGLSIVGRVISKHGGKVWAIGVVDEGATFYFSLPNKMLQTRKKKFTL